MCPPPGLVLPGPGVMASGVPELTQLVVPPFGHLLSCLRGRGLWKFNTSTLEEDAYCEVIKTFWADWRCSRRSFSSIIDWWELGKSKK